MPDLRIHLVRGFLLAWLTSTGFAAADNLTNRQTDNLTVSGSCPGPMTLEVSGALPNARVALLTGDGRGDDAVPGGPCTGTELDVTGDLTLRTAVTADEDGRASRTLSIPLPICGSWIQALETDRCVTSNPAELRFAAPLSIDVGCVPTQNPLRFGCQVTVDPPQPVEVRYARIDGLGTERANRSRITAGIHEVPVVFLAPKSGYLIEAVALAHPLGLSASETIVSGAPPFDVDSRLALEGESTLGLLGGESPCGTDATAVIYDTTTGDLVWYDDIDPRGSLSPMNMLRFTDEHTVIGETGESIVEVDLMGRSLTRFDVDYPGCCNLHHDIFKSNGRYYSLYREEIDGLAVDPLVVINRSGNEIFEWNPRDHLPIPPDARGNWLHANSVWVEADGSVLLSWLKRTSVAKIDLDPESPRFGDVLWIMDGDPPDDLPSDIVIDWSHVPGPDFFKRQHDFHRRHDGRYMLLDNANGRGIVFTIDEENRTATADAVYPTANGTCSVQGTATDTQAGNALVACLEGYVREFDGVSDQLIWQAEIECRNGAGGGTGRGSARWYALDGWSKAFLRTPEL